MKKQLAAFLIFSLLLTLPVSALASFGKESIQYNGNWYHYEYDEAKFKDGHLVVEVTCSDGLPIVGGLPQVPVTCAIDAGGERLLPVETNVSLLGSYAYYFFVFNVDAAPSAVWLYPEGNADRAVLLTDAPGVLMPTPVPTPTPDPLEAYEIMTFGRYEQDDDPDNGPEPIEWLVLESDGQKAVLISKYALDQVPYNTDNSNVTWETCTLRAWMNGDFLNTAFTGEEQTQIMTVLVTADANPYHPTDPGNATYDKVFSLSSQEVSEYFANENARICIPTKYAVSRGAAKRAMDAPVGAGATSWWHRTPGVNEHMAAKTGNDGGSDIYGANVDGDKVAVRPVIVLWLSPDEPMPTPEPIPTPTPVPYPVLQKGAKGEDVKKLQLALIDGGYLAGSADGDFGKKTEAAVIAAQEAFGMEANGVADDALQRRLYGG